MSPLTVDQVREIEPRARSGLVGPTVEAINRYAAEYAINTPLRLAHFLAQIIHESAGLTTFEELGGRSYFARYDGNTSIGKRLGNTSPGDGFRYRGRGPIQCTGRANYRFYGNKLGLDLVSDPERAADPDVGIRIACEYWKAHALNAWADRDDVREITRRINGGLNGLSDRSHLCTLAKDVLGVSDSATPVGFMSLPSDSEIVPSAAIAVEPPKTWWQSKIAWASASIGGLSMSNIWSNVRDAAYEFTDDPISTASKLIDQHPRVVVLTVIIALAAYIIAKRLKMLQELGH